jgi:hypothetical protein
MSAYLVDFADFRRAGPVRVAFLAAFRGVELFRVPLLAARFFAVRFFAARFAVLRFFVAPLSPTRSGSSLRPVERFHSSYCSSVILPSTSSCANLRRWALLLNGIPGF